MLEEEKEKNELMQKIKLLKISMNATFNRTRFQCENLQTGIQRLLNECETLKTINNNIPKLCRNRSQNSSRCNSPSKNSNTDKSESAEEFFFHISEAQPKVHSSSTPKVH